MTTVVIRVRQEKFATLKGDIATICEKSFVFYIMIQRTLFSRLKKCFRVCEPFYFIRHTLVALALDVSLLQILWTQNEFLPNVTQICSLSSVQNQVALIYDEQN